MSGSTHSAEERVHILAPLGRDAELIARILSHEGIDAKVAPSMAGLCDEVSHAAGAILVTEEALHNSALDSLARVLQDQPPWSDVPMIILTTTGEDRSTATWDLVHRLEAVGNVVLLERPLRSITLLSAVRVALRARHRQYEVRSLYEDLEVKVMERTAELKRLNEEAEGFSYSISHDLRSPLRTIVSTSMMLLADHGDHLPLDATYHLNRQAEASKKLAALIDDLLNLSRLSRQEMKVVEIDLTALARGVIEEVRQHRPATTCRFTVEEGLRANGDPLLLRFVLLNLLENACKFSPKGGDVTVGKKGEGVFYVRDQGIGFDMKYSRKLFLPFERLVRDAEFPGTGIGLANVRRIMRRHGGDVWAESEPDKGATFFFALP
ncbi:MAG TPA: ATP-binding protein [Fimbriimonas sp.]